MNTTNTQAENSMNNEVQTTREKPNFGKLLSRFSRLGALLLLCIGISLLNQNFLKVTNLVNVFRQAAPQIIISLGMTIVFLTGGIDLSLGSVVTMTSVVSGYFLTQTDMPWWFAILAAVCAGGMSGFVTGQLIALIKLPPAVASYGMLWVGRGLAFAIMGASPFFSFPDSFRYIGRGYFLGVPMPIWIVLVIALLMGWFLKYTTLGRSLYAIGANPHAARASGIKLSRTLVSAYVLSGMLAAIGGVILAARLNAVDQDMGASFLLPAIASPVMGGTSMAGGQGGVSGTIIGSLIMLVVTNGMNLLGINSLWQQLVTGIVVVLSVWLDVILRKRN
ncbi:MAG: ribose transport system permease protein [Chloroflexota bacterium]|nr:ribose transport system permease protein [Chloroflexota bacterium]